MSMSISVSIFYLPRCDSFADFDDAVPLVVHCQRLTPADFFNITQQNFVHAPARSLSLGKVQTILREHCIDMSPVGSG